MEVFPFIQVLYRKGPAQLPLQIAVEEKTSLIFKKKSKIYTKYNGLLCDLGEESISKTRI